MATDVGIGFRRHGPSHRPRLTGALLLPSIPPVLFGYAHRYGFVALIAYVGWLGWANLGPHKPEPGPSRTAAADRVVQDVVEDLRLARGGVLDTMLLHFENDATDYFSESLRAQLELSGILNLRDRTVREKLLDVLDLPLPTYGTLHDATERARSAGAAAVIYGRIHRFETTGRGAMIDVEVFLADTDTRQNIFATRYADETSNAALALTAPLDTLARGFPWFQRLVLWFIGVTLLPVATIPFLRAAVRQESNSTNLLVLAGYSAVGVGFAWLLIGAAVDDWLSALVFLAAASGAVAYNVVMMNLAVELEDV